MNGTSLLTPQELAALMKIPLSEAWRLGRSGALRPAVVRVGNRMRFRADQVDAYIAAGGGGASLHPVGAAARRRAQP